MFYSTISCASTLSDFFPTLLLLIILLHTIVYKHWPETREFITRTVEFWNRWIRLSCYLEYRTRVNSIHILHLCCNALGHVHCETRRLFWHCLECNASVLYKQNLYLDFNVSHQSRQDGQVILINRNGCNEVFVQIFDELLKGVHVRLSRSLESFTDHIGGFRNVSLNIPTVSNLLTESSSS